MALEWDRELLAAFRAGERSALERVYLAYVDDVFKLIAVAFERDPREQRSLVQDVFVRAFAERARLGYDGLRPYRPYLLTIARNLLVDRARTANVERGRRADVDVDAIIASDGPIPGETTDDPEQAAARAKVAAYVATLDPESRRFVELRFEQSLSQADVADRLEVTRRRVRTLEARVIKGLRRYLKK
jgi:RNA polymerase sigma factor (sigma-70 family)